MTSGPVLSLDFETASTVDLRRAGAVKYAHDPSTFVLCMAWAIDDGPVRVWRPGQPIPGRILDHIKGGHVVRGWNVTFEWLIWNAVLKPAVRITTRQLDDTMARAAYWGLPLSLDQASAAAQLSTKKDKDGHALMKRMTRPRAYDLHGNPLWWHDVDPAKYDRLCAYCATDVEAERELAGKLPPLPHREKLIWDMDFHINMRGVRVDTNLVDRLAGITHDAQKALDERVTDLTGGLVSRPTETGKILKLAKALGYQPDDLKRETIKDTLATIPGGPLKELLTIRREAARASTAKLAALQSAAMNERVYGMLQYYGASRTGRWAGRLFQPQNLPKPSIKNAEQWAEIIANGSVPVEDIELLAADTALGVVASCLRSTLVASPGNLLVSADLSQIEARVIAWLAGQDDVLRVFASGQDIYIYDASNIGSTDRQLGKVCRLGLGFQMGPPRFVATAKTYGLDLSLSVAEDVVYSWRDNNPKIVQFWWDLDRAIRAIAQGDKTLHRVGRLTLYRRGGTMLITLPSGRELVYRGIAFDPDKGVSYLGVNQYTKQWCEVYTYGGKVAENATQAVARDIMADAMLVIDAAGTPLVLSVHDEAVADVAEDEAKDTLAFMLDVMRHTSRRTWAVGLPVDAAGWIGFRYKKG